MATRFELIDAHPSHVPTLPFPCSVHPSKSGLPPGSTPKDRFAFSCSIVFSEDGAPLVGVPPPSARVELLHRSTGGALVSVTLPTWTPAPSQRGEAATHSEPPRFFHAGRWLGHDFELPDCDVGAADDVAAAWGEVSVRVSSETAIQFSLASYSILLLPYSPPRASPPPMEPPSAATAAAAPPRFFAPALHPYCCMLCGKRSLATYIGAVRHVSSRHRDLLQKRLEKAEEERADEMCIVPNWLDEMHRNAGEGPSLKQQQRQQRLAGADETVGKDNGAQPPKRQKVAPPSFQSLNSLSAAGSAAFPAPSRALLEWQHLGRLYRRGWSAAGGAAAASDVSLLPAAVLAADGQPLPGRFKKPLRVAYRDDDVAVVVKPQGIATMGGLFPICKSHLPLAFSHPPRWAVPTSSTTTSSSSSSSSSSSLSLPPPPPAQALSKARPVHRLDAPTGGLLVFALTKRSVPALCALFRDKTIRKRYRAVVLGSLPRDEGVITQPIDGKESKTIFKVVERTTSKDERATKNGREEGFVTTVDLWPVTGRTHQLRKHMLFLGHPIVGDRLYGPYAKTMGNAGAREVTYVYGEDDDKEAGALTGANDDDEEALGGEGEDEDENGIDDEEEDVDLKEDGDGEAAVFEPHSRLCLWCLEVQFEHPFTKENITVEIEEPDWYAKLRKHERERAEV